MKAQDWRADGHRWVNQGTVALPRKNPKIKKKYFYIATENGASKEFVKFVYHEPGQENSPFLIQYIGNDEISQAHAHGNAKNQARPFVRTKPSSLDRWLKQTKSEDPNAVYKNEIHEEEMPRNLKQIQNLCYKGNNEMRISWDALFNIHAIARDSSNEFIHSIHTFPNLVVICGHSLMLDELEKVLYFDTIEQCLSYDTTFQIGDFYVSALIFRHIIFRENPCMPALFLIHERKFQQHHEILFNFLKDKVKLPRRPIACVTDGEIGIINAMSVVPNLVDVRCWNHILQDCGRWLTEKGCIFGQESREKSLEAIDQLQEAWLGDFKKYFNDRISPNLTKVCKWAIDKITRFDPYSGITQNQSESMNKLLKSLNKWKEAPVDVVVLSFLRLHQYYIKEISRGRAGLGNYNLRPQYYSAKIDLSDIVQFAVCQPQDIVNAIRENQFIASPVQEESIKVDDHPKVDIHMSRADELIKNDRIVFSPKLGTFTTKGTDDQSEKTDIKNDPIEMSDKISDKFVTTRRKPVTSVTIEGNNVTENPSRKSMTPVTTESNNVTENPYRKSVTPVTKDVAGPDWLRVGNTTLKDEEKSILYLPNAWLNDRIVDAVQEILKRQFPYIWSLVTCLKASNLTFKRARGNFIQIVNRDPLKGGSHWLTLSTMKLKSANEIKIFDSAFTSMSFPTQQVVCQLLRDGPPKRGDKILLKFMDCAYQNNSDDCGLYAIANAVAEAFDIDPTTQEYDTELMCGHLIHCFEQNEMQLFPARSQNSSNIDGVRFSAYLKIFCTCQMPEDGQYVICDKCSIWYHPECEGLESNQIPKSGISYYCKKCLNPKQKKKR